MNQKKRKMNIRLVLSVFALLTVFWACRKNYSNPLDGDLVAVQKGLSLKEAQAFHRSASVNFKNADRQVMGTDATPPTFSGEPVVRWNKSDSYKDGRFEMLEVPIWFPKTRLTAYSFDGNKVNDVSNQAMLAASFSKYVIYRDPLKNKITARILTFMPDKAYLKKYGRYAIKNTGRHLEKNFSGYIEMRDMKQKSILIVRVKAGKVVKTVRMQRRPTGSKDRQQEGSATMSSCPDICDPEYEMDCHQGQPDPDASGGYEVECTRVEVGVFCYPDPFCSPDPWEWPDPNDCDDPANYYLPQCGYEPNPCEDWGECGPEDDDEDPDTVIYGGLANHQLPKTNKLPPRTTTDVQIGATCVFKTMEWISKYYGGTTTVGDILLRYAQDKGLTFPQLMAVINTNGIPSADVQSLATHYFDTASTTNLHTSINNGHPVMGTILVNGLGHEVMVTGYFTNGIMEYFDPETGTYHSKPANEIFNVIEIKGKK